MVRFSNMTSAALLCAAFLFSGTLTLSAQARAEDVENDTLVAVDWSNTPSYIQKQIKNLVLNCTDGSLTPNKAKIYEYYSPQLPDLRHYIIDYAAWMKVLPVGICNYGPRPCDEDACLVFAYTNIGDNTWSIGARMSVKKLEIVQGTEGGKTVPMAEVTQEKIMCRVANGGKDECVTRFNWRGGKFRFLGYGKEENLEPFTAAPDGSVIPPSDMPIQEEAKPSGKAAPKEE